MSMYNFQHSAPEFMNEGRVSDKSYVHSFGAVLVELVCGKTPDDAVNFIANIATQFLWFRTICLNDRTIGSISVCSYAGGDKCRGKSGEIGYVLGSKYWGKGIATKAVKERVGVVFDEMRELERVEALVDVENVGSQRVLQKCGFVREGVLRKYLYIKGKSRDMVMFSVLSTDPRT
ncbi:putative N-acetyltransferase p20 [Senna tora]|uniref:Putative N-acetyltransferase p20 n=1 Tax=Senna tora TaxID=362788 RepID=A0A834X159_9FABA|nr:putative N-acetyltransferase p20 [Senna tora]